MTIKIAELRFISEKFFWQRDAEKAKDTAAAAVLVASIMSVVIGLIIFIPYIF